MLLGNDGKPALGRCGYGTRIPFMVISPTPSSTTLTTPFSTELVIRFIEDNWLGGEEFNRAAR